MTSEYYKKYYQQNKEEIKEYFKKWVAENREKVRQYQREYHRKYYLKKKKNQCQKKNDKIIYNNIEKSITDKIKKELIKEVESTIIIT